MFTFLSQAVDGATRWQLVRGSRPVPLNYCAPPDDEDSSEEDAGTEGRVARVGHHDELLHQVHGPSPDNEQAR